MTDISIIIPFHSNASYLLTALASIRETIKQKVEILIVQNNEDSTQFVNFEYDESIRSLYFVENLGFSKACNIGAEACTGEFLFFCDADAIPISQEWLVSHLYEMENQPSVGMTSSLLINPTNGRIQDFGIGWSGYNHFHPCYGAALDDPRIQKNRQVQMACSAHMMIRKDVFQHLGGFDENLKYHYQDVDLCLRLNRLGHTVSVIATAKAYHRMHSANVNKTAFQIDERGYYSAKNKDLFTIDYASYLEESLSALPEMSLRYSIIDLSTIYDRQTILASTDKYFKTRLLKHSHQNIRDPEHLNLFERVGRKNALCPSPILYIVDTIHALRHNDFWFTLRANDGDLAIDRHGNAAMVNTLLASQ